MVLAVAFAGKHPEQVARSVDASDPGELAPLLAAVEASVAARVLQACPPRAAAAALCGVAAERLDAIAQAMGPQRLAALALSLPKPERGELTTKLSAPLRRAVERLIEYGPQVAGGIAEPRVACVHEDATVADALTALKKDARAARYYVYVVGANQTLTGVASLRKLMLANPSARVATVMTSSPLTLTASSPLSSVASNPGWSRFPTLPVVSASGELLGVIRYTRYRKLIDGLDDSHVEVDRAASTISALAEVYSIGTSALVHWVGTSLTREGADGE